MKTPAVRISQQPKRRTLGKLTISQLAALLVGLAGLVACNDKDKDEQQSNASKAVVIQKMAAQKPAEKPDADEGEEGEEGPATPAAAAAEKPAPQQPSGKQLIYNFDSDPVGQLASSANGLSTGRVTFDWDNHFAHGR